MGYKIIAVILAFIMNSQSKLAHISTNMNGYTTGIYWYYYVGTQDVAERKKASNYASPNLQESSTCGRGINECSVQVEVTLDPITGLPPNNPDFTGATFNISGFPQPGNGPVVANAVKP